MMKKLIISCFITGSVLTSSPLFAEAPIKPKIDNVDQLISIYADKYDVSERTMHNVIKCESSYKEKAIGDGGNSFGLVQIHLPSHPTITKEQAFDKEYAVEFLAKNLSKGNGKIWTCYRKTHNV